MHASWAIYSLGHNSGIFQNFLVTANLGGNFYFWNFRVALTADWLGNQCTLSSLVMESSQVAGQLLAVSFLHSSSEQIVTISITIIDTIESNYQWSILLITYIATIDHNHRYYRSQLLILSTTIIDNKHHTPRLSTYPCQPNILTPPHSIWLFKVSRFEQWDLLNFQILVS